MTALPLSLVRDAVQGYCVRSTGLDDSKVIFAYQGGPEPKGNSIVITPLNSGMKRGMHDENIQQNNGDLDVIHRRRVSIQVDAHGPNADDVIAKVYDALDILPFYAEFSDNDLSAIFISPIRDVSALKNIRFEQRFNVDMAIEIAYKTTIAVSLDGRTPSPDPSAGSDLIYLDDIGWFNSIPVTDNIKK